MNSRLFALAALGLGLALFSGCSSQKVTIVQPFDDVTTQLPPGEFGLEKLDPKDYPDMRKAWLDRANLEKAVLKSLQYTQTASSKRFYPSGPKDPITHDQVQASLYDFLDMLSNPSVTPDVFQQNIYSRYEVWVSKGWLNSKKEPTHKVWFTGYYTPIFRGSLTPTAEYQYPVYQKPKDLKIDPITGQVFGREIALGQYQPYPTRSQLLASGELKGLELVYFKTPLEAYIIQVQGSAKVILPDGKEMMIGYAGKNGRDYNGIGSQLVADGKISKRKLSLPAILDYDKTHPGEIAQYIAKNDSFVFLTKYDTAEWPQGSMGVQVTQDRSLATDKTIFPRASVTFVTTDKPTGTSDEILPYEGFILDQDTGGAIRAAGRADIYMGIGDLAGAKAGHQLAEGKLYYVFIKPELVGNILTAHPAAAKPAAKPVAKPTAKPAHKPSHTTPAKPITPTSSGNSEDIFPGGKKPN